MSRETERVVFSHYIIPIMKLLDLYEQALKSEPSCIEFLNSFGLFDESIAFCPGKLNIYCGERMKKIRKKNRKGEYIPSWRCTKKLCRTQRSIRASNRFFAFEDRNGRSKCNLPVRQILLIIYFFIYSRDTLEEIMVKTGHNKHTICDWLNLCREVCTRVIRNQPKMVGTDEQPVQIDESYFQGRRKYNTGRLRDGDKVEEAEKKAKEAMRKKEKLGNNYELGRVVGPWVFGLYMSQRRFRFYVVQDRSGDTLSPLIHENVEPESTIVSDKWAAYNRLANEGYKHETVDHSKNFVNPETGFHTQAIERVWKEGKMWLQRARHAGPYLQNHLDEVSWRLLRRGHPNGLFGAFIEDIHRYYSVEIE